MSKKQNEGLDLDIFVDKLFEFAYKKANEDLENSLKVFEDFIKATNNSKITSFKLFEFIEDYFEIEFDNKVLFCIYPDEIIKKDYRGTQHRTRIVLMGREIYPLKKEIKKIHKFLFKVYYVLRKGFKLKENK